MRNRQAKFKKNAILGICWFCAFILIFQVIFWLMTNVWIQDFWDAQYAVKAEYLQVQIAKNPGRPLWLLMGSSRIEDGVAAGILNSEDGPLVFNFGLGGADLFRQLISLRRLLEAGVKPQRVGIEVLGALMCHQSSGFASREEFIVRARKDELDLYARYSSSPASVRHMWLKSRFNPAYIFGSNLPPHSFSWSSFPRFWRGEKPPYDQWGWIPLKPDGGVYEEKLSREQHLYIDQDFNGSFAVSDFTDRAMRQIMDICKTAGIEVFLLRMPESPQFRTIYTPQADAAIEGWLNRTTGEFRIPFIDARSWIDEAGFDDGHHLSPDGAIEFTQRLNKVFLTWRTNTQGH